MNPIDCALPCITNVDYGSCSPSDNACLCKSATYVNTTTTCIESSCTGSDLTTAIATAQALCAEVVRRVSCVFIYVSLTLLSSLGGDLQFDESSYRICY